LHAPEADIEAYKGQFAEGWDHLRARRLARMKALGIVPESLSLSPRHPQVPAWEEAEHKPWQERRMEVYAAQVTTMDRGIGQIIEALKQSGRYQNTLLFFTVDNGGCHVEYGPDRKGDYLPAKTRDGRAVRPGNLPGILPGGEDTYQSYGHGWANLSNTPYRLFKQYDHEGGIRTPMIAHWPAGISTPGKIEPAVSHLIDLLPTVLKFTGIEHPKTSEGKPTVPLDGRSLAAAFKGEPPADHASLFFHHNKGKAIRVRNWKLVAKDKGAWELYDLSNDPLELDNLAAKLPGKANELAAAWQAESKRLQQQADER
jgi:arylsulfatase